METLRAALAMLRCLQYCLSPRADAHLVKNVHEVMLDCTRAHTGLDINVAIAYPLAASSSISTSQPVRWSAEFKVTNWW